MTDEQTHGDTGETEAPLDAAREEALTASVSEAIQADPEPEAAAAADPSPAPDAGPLTLTLYLLRHADAGDPMAWTTPSGRSRRRVGARRSASRAT